MGRSVDPAHRGLLKLMLRLPSRRAELQRMWPDDLTFVSLCEAYDDATTTLERMVVRPLPTDGLLVDEYREICADLEADVERHCRFRASKALSGKLP
jgi:hypothetical protein